jgi:hypothetical protein
MFGKKQEEPQELIFECEFGCLNCYYKWKDRYSKGTFVKQEGNITQNGMESVWIWKNNKKDKLICPYCGANEIRVLERKPIIKQKSDDISDLVEVKSECQQ